MFKLFIGFNYGQDCLSVVSAYGKFLTDKEIKQHGILLEGKAKWFFFYWSSNIKNILF